MNDIDMNNGPQRNDQSHSESGANSLPEQGGARGAGSPEVLSVSADFIDEIETERRTHDRSVRIFASERLEIDWLSNKAARRLVSHLVGVLRSPPNRISALGEDLGKSSRRQITRLRRRIGVAGFQFELIQDLSVKENLEFPCILKRLPKQQIKFLVEKIASGLNLEYLLDEKVEYLGSADKRMALIARALTHAPELFIGESIEVGLDSGRRALVDSELKRMTLGGGAVLLFSQANSGKSENQNRG
ncbi:MAG: hypothetical protein IIB00_03905 [candidate division Zixibacteria bacterium]|nr:hypothetical protein [candidate division Zixibacteria bacterium]